ncbi:MAG: hypothetical protein ABIH46_06230 [Chloroflexota bacterium]
MFRKAPPPERVAWQDFFHIFVAVLCLVSGGILLYRTLSVAVTPMGIVVGLAMVAFGVYRLRLAWQRYRIYCSRQRGER